MKRIIAMLLVVVMTVPSLLSLTGCGKKDDNYVTKGEWIQALGEQMGLNEYVSKNAYFTDVKEDSEYYNYVQSCGDWGILSNEKETKFNPSQTATMDFVLETAILAADVDLGGLSYTEYAIEQGIIENDSYMNTRGKLTREKANEILKWTIASYLYAEKEEVQNVVINENVKNMTAETEEITAVDEDTYSVSSEVSEDVKVGDVVIFPGDAMNPFGIARKVTSVSTDENGNLVLETEEPALEEVCDELDICTTVAPKVEDIIFSDGAKLSSNVSPLASDNGEREVSKLITKKSDNAAIDIFQPESSSFSVDVNFTKGTVSFASAWDILEGIGENIKVGGEHAYSIRSGIDPDAGKFFEDEKTIIPDKTLFGKDPYDNEKDIQAYKDGKISVDELKNRLNLTKDQHEKNPASMTNTFSGGYEITGSLSVSELYVQPEIELKKFFGVPTGIKRFCITNHANITASLSIKGELKEELSVCKMPIPIGSTGVSVYVELILFAELNGELSVRAEISGFTVKAEYVDGTVKKTENHTTSLSAEGGVTLEFGPGVNIGISILGIDIIDAEVTLAVRLKAEGAATYKTDYIISDEKITINRQSIWETQINGYIPIINLKMGTPGTLANKLKISFSWELVGEDNALIIPIYNTGEIVYWRDTQEIQLRDEVEETVDDEEIKEDDIGGMGEYLSIGTYYVNVSPGQQKTIEITNIPKGYGNEDIIWNSDNEEVVSVSNGVITANKSGNAIITVKTTDGTYQAECSVSVEETKVEYTPVSGNSDDGLAGGGLAGGGSSGGGGGCW